MGMGAPGTPVAAALTLRRESARRIAAPIARIERGLPVDGVSRTPG